MSQPIIHRIFRFAFACTLMFICNASSAQNDIQKRIVEGEKKFRNNIGYDTFKTAEDACKHWAQNLPLPQGYTYHSYNMNENGGCQCIFKKQGSADNDQGGQVWAIMVCPENASNYNKGQNNYFADQVCLCNQGFKPKGKTCEPDSCAEYENMGEDGLKNWAQNKLQKFCDEENEAFKNDPSGSIQPKSGPPILSENEIRGYLNLGKKTAANGQETYADFVWNMVYGHVLERMVARRVEKDKCLKEYLEYVKNSAQTNEEGTNPDFRGKGKLPAKNEFDITTPEQVIVKMNDSKKAHFIFVTYTRLFTSDDLAASQPATNPKPPKLGKPPAKTDPKTPATNPKTPAKPPKSSTDGR